MDEIALAKSSVKYAGWISMVEACQNSGLPVRVWCKARQGKFITLEWTYCS